MKKNILFYFLLFPLFVFSQNNILYLQSDIPQSMSLNPATNFACKTYIGIPALSSLQYAFHSSSFSYANFIRAGSGTKIDSLIFDYDNVFSQIKRNNRIRNAVELVWFDFGFRKNNRYFSFTLKSKLAINIYYTDDLFGVLSGNWNSSTDKALNFNLVNNKFDALAYTALSGSVAQNINSATRFGIRISYLQGAAIFQAKKSDFLIQTTENPVAVKFVPDYSINTSFPSVLSFDSQGLIEKIRPSFSNPISNFLLNKNRGFSTDIGIETQYSDKIKFSASVLDLGFIYWKSNTLNLKTSGVFEYKGLDINNYSSGMLMQTDIQALLKDSVKQLFHYTQQQKNFLSFLPVQIYLSGSYKWTKKMNIGLVSHFFLVSRTIFFTQNILLDYKFNQILGVSGSLTYMNNTVLNTGFVIRLKKEPFQFYFASDNLPIKFVKDIKTSYILPTYARSVNFRIGFNLVFGCQAKDRSRDNTICPAYH